jgi:hypothetical protein
MDANLASPMSGPLVPLTNVPFVFLVLFTDLVELPMESHTRARWILTFIDNCSAFAFLAFLHRKNDTALRFGELVLHVETLTGLFITSVRSDHGGEYLGQELV